MAKAEKIYDIAEKLGYEGATGGNTSDAINACADALGFVGPHEKRITSALADLYTVVGGGGGGDLGALQPSPMLSYSAEPVVGGGPDESLAAIWYVKVGDSVVIEGDADLEVFPFSKYYAAGCTIAISALDAYVSSVDGYIVTLDGSGKFATVAAWGGTITKTASIIPDSHDYLFTMPTLSDGEHLVLYQHSGGGGEDISV